MNFLLLILVVTGVQSAKAQRPILLMKYSSQGIPFLAEFLRDPTLVRSMAKDDLAYE